MTCNGVTAKIFKATQIQNGKEYHGFIVVYSLLGKRKREWRAKLADAQTVARNACDKISNGDHLTLQLTNNDRMTYLRAIQPVAEIGVELDVAAREYASIIKRLPPGTTITQLLDSFCHRNPLTLEKRTVQQVVDEMVIVKQAAKLSDVHLKDLEGRLKRFADDLQMNISDVSGKLIQAWLDAMDVRGRTKQNYLRHVMALFRFAISRKYLPKDAIDEIEAVQMPKLDTEEPKIFNPGEMLEILSVARPEMIPWLAIGGFAGIRSAEIKRLDWSEVNLRERFIEIKASNAKTAARRLWHVPTLSWAFMRKWGMERARRF